MYEVWAYQDNGRHTTHVQRQIVFFRLPCDRACVIEVELMMLEINKLSSLIDLDLLRRVRVPGGCHRKSLVRLKRPPCALSPRGWRMTWFRSCPYGSLLGWLLSSLSGVGKSRRRCIQTERSFTTQPVSSTIDTSAVEQLVSYILISSQCSPGRGILRRQIQ